MQGKCTQQSLHTYGGTLPSAQRVARSVLPVLCGILTETELQYREAIVARGEYEDAQMQGTPALERLPKLTPGSERNMKMRLY